MLGWAGLDWVLEMGFCWVSGLQDGILQCCLMLLLYTIIYSIVALGRHFLRTL